MEILQDQLPLKEQLQTTHAIVGLYLVEQFKENVSQVENGQNHYHLVLVSLIFKAQL